jgi:hypothetical protein
MLAPFTTSQLRDLATSQTCDLATSRWLNRRVFTLLIREFSRCVVPPYALPRVHKNLGSSTLCDSTSTRVSAPRHFATRHPHESRLLGTSRLDVLCATCTPLTLRYGPHYSTCRDIAISQPRDPRGQILVPFLARSRDTIPRSDPMVLLCSGSNDCPSLPTSRPRDLEYKMFRLSTCELLTSRDPSISHHLSSSDGRL